MFKFKEINWALVLVLLVVAILGVIIGQMMLKQVTVDANGNEVPLAGGVTVTSKLKFNDK